MGYLVTGNDACIDFDANVPAPAGTHVPGNGNPVHVKLSNLTFVPQMCFDHALGADVRSPPVSEYYTHVTLVYQGVPRKELVPAAPGDLHPDTWGFAFHQPLIECRAIAVCLETGVEAFFLPYGQHGLRVHPQCVFWHLCHRMRRFLMGRRALRDIFGTGHCDYHLSLVDVDSLVPVPDP